LQIISVKHSQVFDQCLNLLMLAGLFGVAISVINGSAATAFGPVVNGTSITSISSPFDWSILGNIAPYLTFLVTGLAWLYKHWKGRNWKKKYDNVVVAKPFS
jgi:hypothetical protein